MFHTLTWTPRQIRDARGELFARVFRCDADETATFLRQLESIDAVIYKVEYPAFQGLDLVPVMSGVSDGAEFYTYYSYDKSGVAKRVVNFAQDFPRVDIQGKMTKSNIASYGASYGYSIQDLRRAAQANVPLEVSRAAAAHEAIARQVDNQIWFGDTEAATTGLANDSEVSLVSVTNGNWDTETDPLKILADLTKLETASYAASKGIEMPDTFVLPQVLRQKLTTLPLGTNADHSIMDFFLAKSQFVKNVEWAWQLNLADAAGTKPRALCYKRDPMKLGAVLPIEYEQFPPQQEGMSFQIPCHARAGGVVIRYPGSVKYMDGISSV